MSQPPRRESLVPVEPIRFFLAGPTYVPRAARETMTAPVEAHRSPHFKEVYASITARLKPVFRTARDCFLVTGSSTLVMEMAISSLVDRDVLCLTNGAFSERFQAIARSLGRRTDRVEAPWGRAVDPDLVRQALRRKRYEAVTVVHNETSTGVENPLEEIARVVREESDALLLVDSVSALGGAPLETDDWGLDLVLAGTQKALAAPPGMAVFTYSERAEARAEARPHRGFYTDVLRYRDKHATGGTITTPAVHVAYALEHQLRRIEAEGVEARWRRHAECARIAAEWVESRADAGLSLAAAQDARSRTLTCVRHPAAPAVVAAAAKAGFTLAGGYGDWKPTTFRIGHMGEVRPGDLETLFPVLDDIVRDTVRDPLEKACTAS